MKEGERENIKFLQRRKSNGRILIRKQGGWEVGIEDFKKKG